MAEGTKQEQAQLRFTLNGASVVAPFDPQRRLLSLLREAFGLTSAREGCGVGRCGACLVLLDGMPVNACLVLSARLEGRGVVTAEGLGLEGDMVRAALAEGGAVQCGYCTPALVVMLSWLSSDRGDPAAMENGLAGQICRCTGYGGTRRALELLHRASAPPTSAQAQAQTGESHD